ncbi:MAG: DUF4365 domain-containing protein [Gammaproteobacteria bacterium]|nr:DUF4365 domain-containing protein [Gammaproteobacteria bacterium]
MSNLFKKNSAEYDFGIDGYIEIVTEEGAVTGQVIASQIKCGRSFFKTKTKTGFTFYGENKYLNYYCNAPFPVIIIACDGETKDCYWAQFSVDKTEKTSKNWKINIPKRNKLTGKSKRALLDIIGEFKIKYWFFFCSNQENNSTLIWLLTCLTNIISVEKNLQIKMSFALNMKLGR